MCGWGDVSVRVGVNLYGGGGHVSILRYYNCSSDHLVNIAKQHSKQSL